MRETGERELRLGGMPCIKVSHKLVAIMLCCPSLAPEL